MSISSTGRLIVCIALVLGLGAPALSQTSNFNVDKRYVHAMAGQSLFQLIISLFPDDRDHWLDLADAFVQLNPHAFDNLDPDRIIEGARLEVPRELRSVGVVTDLTGEAYRTNVFGERFALQPGASVHVGDKVVTAEDADAIIDAEDDARFFLRKRTRFSIVEYKLAQAAKDNRSVLQLLQGSLRAITGEIGARSPNQFRLMTPMATIGIRGTDFALRLCEPGECEAAPGLNVSAAPGLYVSVLQGTINVSNDAGARALVRGDFFYVPDLSKAAQRLYEQPRLVLNEQELASLPAPQVTPSPEPTAPVAVAPVAENPKSASLNGLLVVSLLLLVGLRRRITAAF